MYLYANIKQTSRTALPGLLTAEDAKRGSLAHYMWCQKGSIQRASLVLLCWQRVADEAQDVNARNVTRHVQSMVALSAARSLPLHYSVSILRTHLGGSELPGIDFLLTLACTRHVGHSPPRQDSCVGESAPAYRRDSIVSVRIALRFSMLVFQAAVVDNLC